MTTLPVDTLANLNTLNAKMVLRTHLTTIGTSPTRCTGTTSVSLQKSVQLVKLSWQSKGWCKVVVHMHLQGHIQHHSCSCIRFCSLDQIYFQDKLQSKEVSKRAYIEKPVNILMLHPAPPHLKSQTKATYYKRKH